MKLDHARAVSDQQYASETRSTLIDFARRDIGVHVDVSHDSDGACCRREPWPITRTGILRDVFGDVHGEETRAFFADQHERALIAARREIPRSSDPMGSESTLGSVSPE